MVDPDSADRYNWPWGQLLGRQRGVFPDHPIKVPDSTDEIFQVLYELAV
jgi:hypothetical protein